jgi:predicted transposase/invertase (TIGR01784 family)
MPAHDNAYKNIFSHPQVVADLLTGFVAQEWVHAVDLTTLDKCNGSYVSDDLRDRQDDLVWRVRRGDEVAYVYLLLEFQSSADVWMALRVMVYVGLLYQDLIKTGVASSPGQLPAVFPIVIYNGDPAWAACRDVAELIQPLPGGLTAYRPSLRYHLLDEGRVQTLAADNTVADLIEIESAAEREQMQTVVDRLSKRLAGPQNTELRRALAVWIRRVVAQRLPPQAKLPAVTELSEVQAMLSRNVTRWDVRAMEKGRQEGRQEGRLEGRQEGLIEGHTDRAQRTLERLLTRRFGPLPPEALGRIHDAALPQLETWLDRIIDAPTWQAVFEEH